MRRLLAGLGIAGLLASAASAATAPTLGSRGPQTFRYAVGWGQVRPTQIFNGGDPSGDIVHVSWKTWGGPAANGWGKTFAFKPHGGYYQKPVLAHLHAQDLGKCSGHRAYRQLWVSEQTRPGGPFTRWFSWSGSATICDWAG